jgi:DNA-directed RNA polymerase subunit M/transcription elongation factor TFIIS
MAMKHATEDSRTYPCEACGGELHFDIRSQLLKCAHCGNTHELVENDGQVNENDLREALKLVQSSKQAHEQNFVGTEKEITCQNCGGNTMFSGSLTAEKCPYCATPIQRDDVHDAPERLPVDGVLPFSVDDKQAKELIEKWISKRWFAPSEFKTYSRTGAFSSVYTAYFTYDADTRTNYRGRRGDNYTVTVGSGDNRRTETRTNWTRASGTVNNSFDDITVFANEGFERNRIAKLEPWPTESAKPYSAEYAAGHLRRTYDHDVEECLPEATSQMEASIQQTVRRDIGGDQQDINSMDISWLKMTYKHLLLPIWLLTVIYEQKPFQVYINGVTGEVHGARPYSKVKILTAVMLVALVIVIIAIAVSAGGGG